MMKKIFIVALFLLLINSQASALTVTLMDSSQGFAQSLVDSIFFDSETFLTADTGSGTKDSVVNTSGDGSDLIVLADQNTLHPIVLEVDATEFEFDNTVIDFDATVLEVDFALEETIYFDSFFTSPQYSQHTVNKSGPNNDAFTFFLRGQQVTLASGMTTPVSLDKINGQNDSPLVSDDFQLQAYSFDYGFSDTFVTTFSRLLTADQRYQLKMAINAVGDYVHGEDSFQTGSFSGQSSKPTLEPSTLLFFGVVGLVVIAGGSRRRRRKLR